MARVGPFDDATGDAPRRPTSNASSRPRRVHVCGVRSIMSGASPGSGVVAAFCGLCWAVAGFDLVLSRAGHRQPACLIHHKCDRLRITTNVAVFGNSELVSRQSSARVISSSCHAPNGAARQSSARAQPRLGDGVVVVAKREGDGFGRHAEVDVLSTQSQPARP
jgi:hypothetical protein